MTSIACEPFVAVDEVTCECEGVEEAVIESVIDTASDIIAILTEGQVSGRCTDVVRPRRVSGGSSCGCWSPHGCGCSDLTGITLRGPNPTITGIRIDGAAFTAYKVIDGQLLVRSDGRRWPECQDITRPATEVDTFEITYVYGVEINQLIKDATLEIVCSLLKTQPQKARTTHPGTRGMSVAGVQITLEQQSMEIQRRAFMMPSVIRLMTVYSPGGPQSVVYSPEIEDGWRLHRVS